MAGPYWPNLMYATFCGFHRESVDFKFKSSDFNEIHKFQGLAKSMDFHEIVDFLWIQAQIQ